MGQVCSFNKLICVSILLLAGCGGSSPAINSGDNSGEQQSTGSTGSGGTGSGGTGSGGTGSGLSLIHI